MGLGNLPFGLVGGGSLGVLGGAGWWLPGAAVAADFANASGPRYYGGTFTSMISFTRSTVKTDLFPSSPSGYAYNTYAIDAPVIITGRGLSVERTVTNYFLNSTAPANQTVTIPSTGDYTLWVNGSGSATVAANTAGISLANGGNNVATQGNPVIFNVYTTGTVDVTISGSLNAVQLENGAGGTSLIVTAGASVQRGEDKPALTGTAASIGVNAAPFTGTVVVSSESTNGTPNFSSILQVGSQAVAQNTPSSNGFYDNNNAGGNSITTTLGTGDRSNADFGVTWNSTSRSFVANGGSPNLGNSMYSTTNPGMMLGNGPNGNAFNGFIKSFNVFLTVQSAENLRAFTKKNRNFRLTAFGDSLTARNDGIKVSAASSDFGVLANSTISYPSALETLFSNRFSVLNGGVEGQTSTSIKTRFLNTPSLWGLPVIIWAGRNNIASQATVLADIAAMVGVLTTPNYLVLSVINSATENSGSAGYTQISDINSALASTYGSNYLDIRSLLVAAYNPANGVDVINQGNDVPPFTLRSRNIQGRLTVAVNSSVTTFTTNTSGLVNTVISMENELILVTAVSGSTVTACTRGYGGTTAASHAINTRYSSTDILHLGEAGRQFVAQKIYDKIQALGGWGL